MKIGVSSYSFSKYKQQTGCDVFAICDKAKELGFEGIEFVELSTFGENVDEVAEAAKVRAHCENLGLSILAFCVGANFLADDIDAEMQRLRHCVDVTAALGAPLMRHDVVYALRKEPLYNYRLAIEEIAPRIREITQYAKSRGVRTCTENHGYIFQAPERVEALLLAVNDPNYGWLCDIGNFLCADCDPVQSVAIAAPYAFHAHVKDFLKKPYGGQMPSGFFPTVGNQYLRGTVIGHGVVPVENCISVLKKAGYDAWISVEFEGMEDTITALQSGLTYLQNCLKNLE